ncbi:hypothetical protein KP509_24G038700 [Ceratopteris richardii]|nr:hypothetical protein KP509_24G038700 [Ceratopteris richardii]
MRQRIMSVKESKPSLALMQRKMGAGILVRKLSSPVKGYVPVYVVGDEEEHEEILDESEPLDPLHASNPNCRLYLIKTKALNWPSFIRLLDHTAEECGYPKSQGALTIFCSFRTFEDILNSSSF